MTSPTSNGGSESSTLCDERFVKAAAYLDAFELSLGLPRACPAGVVNEASRLLALEPGLLSRMSCAQCAEGAFVLAQYAFFLQRSLNEQQAALRYANSLMKRGAAPFLASVSGYSMEERMLGAVGLSPEADRASREAIRAQLKLDRLSFLAVSVQAVCKTLTSLAYSKQADGGD